MADETVAFTVRMPRGLCAQIEARAALNHRSRNGELNAMLENAIDATTAKDLEEIRRIRNRTVDEA